MKGETLILFGVFLMAVVGSDALEGSAPKFIQEPYENSKSAFLSLSKNPVVVYSPGPTAEETISELAVRRKNEETRQQSQLDEDDEEDVSSEEQDDNSEETADADDNDSTMPEDKPTRPDYEKKGAWARGELPGGKNIDVGFVPQQIYSQVRKYDRVIRLPQEEALKEAKNSEEAANAARLREVLSHKKIQQVYEEEGYEDAGYDHAGYNHHGAKYEDHEKHLEEGQRKKLNDSNSDSTKELETYLKPPTRLNTTSPTWQGEWKNVKTETNTKKMKFDASHSPTNNKTSPVVTMTKLYPHKSENSVGKYVVVNGRRQNVNVSNTAQPATYEEKDSEERERTPRGSGQSNDDSVSQAESRSASIDETDDDRFPEGRVINRPHGKVPLTPPPLPNPYINKPRGRIVFPGSQARRLYAKPKPAPSPSDGYMEESIGYNVHRPFFHSTLPVSPNIHHYLVAPAFPTFFTESPPPQAFPSVLALPPRTTLQPPPGSPLLNQGPVQFASADMLNAFASIISNKDKAATPSMMPPDTHEGSSDNNEKVVDKTPVLPEPIEAKTTEKPVSTTTRRPRRRKPEGQTYNTRNKPYSSFNRTGVPWMAIPDSFETTTWSSQHPSMNTRHPSLPRDTSETKHSSMIKEPVRPKSTFDLEGPVKHVEQLTLAHYSSTPPAHLKSPPQVQSERLKELARQLNSQSGDASVKLKRRRRSSKGPKLDYDEGKYPFYGDAGIHKDSALRYASNPAFRPKKTEGGMEFYESRDKLVRCPESPEPPSNPVPERTGDGEWSDKPQPDDLPRVRGVGDTINCLKVKYFGADPFDNPFFKEDEEISPPVDTNSKEARTKKAFFPGLLRQPTTKRIMILPNSKEHASVNGGDYSLNQRQEFVRPSNGYNNGYSDQQQINFPYQNHKPETASVSPTVQKLRAVKDSPYPFYNPNLGDNDTLAREPEAESSRNKYQLFGGGLGGGYTTKVKHKNVIKKKRRYRPNRPVAVYSIFGSLGGAYSPQQYYYPPSPYYQNHHQPPYYYGSAPVPQVVPVMEGVNYHDSYGSGSENKKSATLYVVRPGEYTENKQIAQESQNSGIWNYINPLKWWFPKYFDNRRNEPRYRKRRDVIGKIIGLGNLTVPVFPASATLLPANHKPETTTGHPISLSEYKAKLNITGNTNENISNKQLRAQARLNRLTGALQLRGAPSPTSSGQLQLSSKLILSLYPPHYDGDHNTTPSTLLQAQPPQNVPSSTESVPPMSSTRGPRKGKFKILFPRTKAPPKRTPNQAKKTSADSREVPIPSTTTTTTTTTTTQSPSTTTRMYKPKRVVKKPYNLKPGTPLDMFTVLKTTRRSSTSPSSEESNENRRLERDEPRRMQQVEHRRVTKEEVIKTSFMPEEHGRPSRQSTSVGDEVRYSVSGSENNPIIDLTTSDNHTLTYMVNPATGVGSWTESPPRSREKAWKPSKRRKQDNSSGNRSTSSSLFTYPVSAAADSDVTDDVERIPRRNRKRQRDVPQFDNEAYIMGLLGKVPPVELSKRTKYKAPLRLRGFSELDKSSSLDDPLKTSSGSDGVDEEHYHTSSDEPIDETEALDETELTPSVTKAPPKFILDPGKRKYYYVNDR